MSSSRAGSAAAAVTLGVHSVHERSNMSLSSASNRFSSVNSFEIIYRAPATGSNNNESQRDNVKVVINIRGTIFETFESTLLKYPDTLLGSTLKRSPYYDARKQQYCFERNREAFNAILYYYQSSGKLARPCDVTEEIFLEELEFFEIDPQNVTELEYGSANFRIPKKKGRSLDVIQAKKCIIHDMVLSWPCGLIVALYMLITCLSSIGEYQLILPWSCSDASNTTDTTEANNHPVVILHYICTLCFLLEYMFRILRSEIKLKYIKSILGIIDLVTVLSTISQLLLRQFDVCHSGFLIWFTNFVRFSSILCMFKLARYSTGLRLFGQTVKACSGQLVLSFYCVGICLLFFSTLLYFTEEAVNQNFTSILDAFWYTIVTLTTVGYGDLVPVSILGKIFGSICSVFGVTIVMAWPATIFVSYFTEIYNYEIGQKKKKSRKFWSNRMYKFRKGLMRLDKKGCTFR